LQDEPGRAVRVPRALERVPPALTAVDAVLRRVAEHGLQRATTATRAELQAVAAQAHHARLVRLERELEALSTQLGRYLERDPLFRPAHWVAGAARVWLLVGTTRAALAQAETPADLEAVAGTPRRRYVEVAGAIEVQAVAASGWVTDSGYAGVTVQLWQRDAARWLQAAVVRPQTMVGAAPQRLLRMSVNDTLGLTTQMLAHGAWTLRGVRLSQDGRLSLHQGLQVAAGAPLGRTALDPLYVASGAEAVDRLARGSLSPLDGVGSVLVYLEPVDVGAVTMDETQARAVSSLRDSAGATVPVVVSLRPENDILIDNLTMLASPAWQPDGMVVRAALSQGRLVLHPLTAVFLDPVTLPGVRLDPVHEVHLTLEPLKGAQR